MIVTYTIGIENHNAMKKIALILLCLLPFSVKAGENIDDARINLIDQKTGELYAMVKTNDKGEFGFINIVPGEYLLQVKIPKTAITPIEQYELPILNELIDLGCDKENGRMVFKLENNCFVFDLDCRQSQYRQFTPKLEITHTDTEYTISIAIASLKEVSNVQGMLQKLDVKSYKRCVTSGKFIVPENAQ